MYPSTVDENQMKIFDNYSSQWWDFDGPLSGLNKTSGFFVKHTTEVALKHNLDKQEVKVLDVGCGGGLLSEPLARHGYWVIGIDVNEMLIKVAQKHAPSLNNLTYKLQSIEDHAVDNVEKYDIVILNFVLQHAKHHDVILRNCAKVLKPGGLIFITSAAKTFTAWMRVVILGEHVNRYMPRGANNWNNFISAKDVEAVLRDNNCVVRETKGLYYNILAGNWNWYGNVDGGFYSMYAVKM